MVGDEVVVSEELVDGVNVMLLLLLGKKLLRYYKRTAFVLPRVHLGRRPRRRRGHNLVEERPLMVERVEVLLPTKGQHGGLQDLVGIGYHHLNLVEMSDIKFIWLLAV